MGEIMRPYKRLVYIRTSQAPDLEGDRRYSLAMAARFNLRYEEKLGNSELLRRMVDRDWGSEFVVVDPEQSITLEHFLN